MSAESNKGNKKGILLAALIIPILVAIGVVAGYYFTSSNMAEGETVFAKVEEEEEVTVPLEEFLVNVNSSSGRNRYVRMEISLSSKNEDAEEIVTANLAKIRDTVIYALFTQTSESVFEGEDGRFALKKALRNRINETLSEEVVSEVYITNIVMQ